MSNIQLGKGKVSKGGFGGNTPTILVMTDDKGKVKFRINDTMFDIASSKQGHKLKIVPMYVRQDLKYLLTIEVEQTAKMSHGSIISKNGLFSNKTIAEDISGYVKDNNEVTLAHMEENERLTVHTSDKGLDHMTPNELAEAIEGQIDAKIIRINAFRLDINEAPAPVEVQEEEIPQAA